MALLRPASPLVQRWMAWLYRHCDIEGHKVHLRHQCRDARKVAVHGASLIEDPQHVPSTNVAPPAAAEWLEWQEPPCTVTGHNVHLRYQCHESLEQSLRGCVTEAVPND